jgi:alpha-ketoglutarate-dependent taurine dioxygenase
MEGRAHFEDGRALGAERVRSLCRLVWDHAAVIQWNRGDILLVDNARIAHCKLPHDGNRQLWTAFGDPFYIEAPRSNSELPTPDLGEINLW